MPHKFEIEKEYPATAYGERVGWVRAKEVGDDGDHIAIDLVSAEVVSEEGAQYGNQSIYDNDGVFLTGDIPYQKGFGRVAAFSALLGNESMWQYEFNLHYVPEGLDQPDVSYNKPSASGLLASGTGDTVRYFENSGRVWVEHSSELLATLKEILTKLKFEDAYDTVYYWVNGAVGREYPAQSELTYIHPSRLILPDTSMQKKTRVQVEATKAMVSALTSSLANDETTRHRLSGFIIDTPMDTLPDAFIASRTRASELEERVSTEAGKLIVQRLAHMPPGQGRAGRTWPYMNAVESDVDNAYGLELRDLRARKTDRAIRELDRERGELGARQMIASEALQRFERIQQLEEEMNQ
jgi:hypothetical protein